MKITSSVFSATNVPADLLVSPSGLVTGIPATQGTSEVPVHVTTNYGEATGGITIIVNPAESALGMYSANGTWLGDITLSDLRKKIGDGVAQSEYGLGAYFSVPYTDPFDGNTYDCQFRFGHFGYFTKADGTGINGLGLDCVQRLPSTDIQYDAPEPNNSDSDRKKYGNNRYMYSNIHQWMNAIGLNWYQAKHTADAPPTSSSNLTSVHGLLDCFPSKFIDHLSTVRVRCKTAEVDGGGVDSVDGKFFLLSVNELGYASADTGMVGANVEGEFWGLYKQLSGFSSVGSLRAFSAHDWLKKARISNLSSFAGSFTRSVALDIPCYVWAVSSDGFLAYSGAHYVSGFSPACVLSGM